MSTPPADAFEHVRGRDRERIGWIAMTPDDRFVPYDLLWRQVGEPSDLTATEAVLDELGLRYLAEKWEMVTEDGSVAVQIVEITADTVAVAPVLDSENVALALDLTRRTTLPNPTDLLRPRRN